MEYLISRDGQRYGPYTAEAIQQLRADGRIVDTDLCWTEGMPGWQLVVNAFDHAEEPAPEPPEVPVASNTGTLAPMPPSLHWFIVLALSTLTLGVFGWAWMFVQAAWVRKFDPHSRATALLTLGLFTAIVGGYVAARVGAGNEEAGALVEMLATLSGAFFLILAAFKMRGSIQHHFTQLEPMNVSLSGAMTFFFTFVYLQYHLTRIAEAKRNLREPGATS